MNVSANTAAFIRDAFDHAVMEYGEFDLAPETFQAAVVALLPRDAAGLEAALPRLNLADLYLAQACVAGRDDAWRILRKRHRAELAPDENAAALLATYDGAEPLGAWLVAAGKATPRQPLPGGPLLWIAAVAAAVLFVVSLWTDRSGEPDDDDLIAAFRALQDDDAELFKGIEPLLAEGRAATPAGAPSRVDFRVAGAALRVRMHRGLKAIDRLADARVRRVVRAQFLIRLALYDQAAAELDRAPPSELAQETAAWLRRVSSAK